MRVPAKKWPRKTGIMFAVDVKSKAEAFRILDLISDDVDVIKFNYPLILKEGLSVITDIKARYGIPVFADIKIADVPVTNDRIIRLAAEAGADGVMAHGFIGVDAIQSMQQAAPETKIFLITQLTNPGGLDFSASFTQDFAEMARGLGLDGVQAPGNRPEVVAQVRDLVGPGLTIVCCGVGAQGGKYGHAIAAGADFEIIGRAIYQAEDPVETVKHIKAATQQALKTYEAKTLSLA
ncbi:MULTISPECIES: orotidine-5'-phosphate decarboxylase [Vibrio]|jgi:orotidine-5'-phosphate decarboxylase|uniref:orotidine-5'-phosphate decarboxylase n=1 Tax=Vibrio TaxID=662 RepID=UPI00178C98F4|nr:MULTISPECIES: orotidine-5'-phosphate decarboxylase [Vibrio]MDL5029125.1 orotidine-5'-phosphate decarboxylase [Vibrio sp. TMPB1044]MDN3632863.1 orotidine-5'-phosphate decarboxylase [Vibrio lentus]MDN5209253.1 orotidine-5'-phosphate decarboxylase [Vibrio sp. TMPB1044]